MTQRLNYAQLSPEQYQQLIAFSAAVRNGVIEEGIIDLIEVRASQLNGCGFCLDMHIKQATIRGESALRLHHVAIWRESPLFQPRERAALAWAESLTKLSGDVPDELYEHVRGQFSEKEISDLTFAVMAINAWNRAGVAFRAVPGSADKVFGLDKAGLR
ncbi:carboxymuconolactone decarboxylase family protein [Sodalis sp. C49]|uniref:carboxymuconolactone decarboxylase family protein n=1 Tax=unclassified Sodalis (in: enterobacteria) TaxID=2636512 RepID=UPI003965A716